jgi:hypothetical protein
MLDKTRILHRYLHDFAKCANDRSGLKVTAVPSPGLSRDEEIGSLAMVI